MPNTLRRSLSNPLISIVVLVVFSILALAVYSLEHVVLCFLIAVVFAIAVGVRPRKLVIPLSYATLVLIVHTAIAAIVQLFLIGYIDVYMLILTTARIETLLVVSIAVVESIDIVKFISLLRRVSVRLSLAIALSLKMMRDFTRIWGTVRDTYGINLGLRGLRKKLLVYMLMVKVFITLSLYSAIQSAEAIITRSRLYTNQRDR